ncbi:hypothetical protein HS125_09750 [bacterium]|nr:hypothetical protein [bacterium]
MRTLRYHQGRWNDMHHSVRMYPLIEFDAPVEMIADVDSGLSNTAGEVVNRFPQVALLAPAGGEVVAFDGVVIEWQVVDPDGDPVAVTLRWSDESDGGREGLIAAGLPESGSLAGWVEPTLPAAPGPDFTGDGQVDFRDAFLFAGSWEEAGRVYRNIAVAEDPNGGVERARSKAVIRAEPRFPREAMGLVLLVEAWHGEP